MKYLFVNRIIAAIQKYEQSLTIEPKNCILRINRDIRFSKDKTPYNLHYTAFVSKGGRKDKNIPGIFLRFSTEMIGIMGGCFGPTKEQLKQIRLTISKDITVFKELVDAKEFVQKFGEIRGDKMKRISKEWKDACEKEPLVANKQFYFVGEESTELITSESLLEEIIKYWHVMKPVNDYLTKIIQ